MPSAPTSININFIQEDIFLNEAELNSGHQNLNNKADSLHLWRNILHPFIIIDILLIMI
jgi:hypothetical protein